jgi:hypothetical protein
MESLPRHQPRALLALGGVIITLLLGAVLISPSGAEAGTSGYCGNVTLGGYGGCTGSFRSLYAVFGWGDQHSVCVRTVQVGVTTCSGGAGQGTYDNFGFTFGGEPQIFNNAAGNNTVHGVSYN